ncbi:MAG: hypothetical protein KC486_17210 [Myxococcales bacterium]|nr:hypothetical protein [Myxococcales bacterium]
MEARILSSLADTIQRSREFLGSRESVTQALVLPLLRALGYATSDPLELRCGQALDLQGGGSATADIAIYEGDGETLRLVLDVRPLGADLWARSALAPAVGAAKGLRFLAVTDGDRYHVYGDTQQPGALDPTPLFAFTLVGGEADHAAAAQVLTRFARDTFDPDALVTKAEDDALREALTARLVRALRAPAADPDFLRWISEGVYEGKRTRPVLERLGGLAEEAVTPAILAILSDDYIDHLHRRLRAANAAAAKSSILRPAPPRASAGEPEVVETIRQIAARGGADPKDIAFRDTTNYLGIGLGTPGRWFLRWFDGNRRRALTTLVPAAEAEGLVKGFKVEEAPQSFGVSRVHIDDPAQLWALEALIVRSLEICRRGEQLAIAGSGA